MTKYIIIDFHVEEYARVRFPCVEITRFVQAIYAIIIGVDQSFPFLEAEMVFLVTVTVVQISVRIYQRD